jgi:hypothetical protein
MIIIGVYVNDCLIIGKDEIIDCLIDELKKHELNLKVERNVNEYLSCCIEESKNERKRTLIQPHLLTHLISEFTYSARVDCHRNGVRDILFDQPFSFTCLRIIH